MPLNLSRFLDRLGLTTQQQPHLLDTLQPVVVLQDLSRLSSNPLWCSYLVGSNIPPTALSFAGILVTTPVPLRIREMTLGVSGAMQVAIHIGNGAPSAADNLTAILNTLQPHLFRPEKTAEATWFQGDYAAGATATDPVLRLPTTSSIILHEVIVPAGGYLSLHANSVTNTLTFTAIVDEMPGDLTP